MKSTRCHKCSLTQALTDVCKRCGAEIKEHEFTSQRRTASFESPSTGTYSNPPSGDGRLRSGLAIASMVLAIVAFPTMFLLVGLVLAPVAVVMGIVAVRRANREPMAYGGKGFAVAGIAIGALVTLVFTPIIIAIAIPNLYASKRAADEMAAFDVLEKIAIAQDKHAIDNVDCGDLATLKSKNLIDAETASGNSYGYSFVAKGKSTDPQACEVTGTPISGGPSRSFYFSNKDNTVRIETNGAIATHNSPPLKAKTAAVQ